MSTDLVEHPETVSSSTAAKRRGNAGRGGNLVRIAVLLVIVMAVEAGVFYFLGLFSTSTSDNAASLGTEAQAGGEEADDEQDIVEIEIDSFNVTNRKAIPDSVVHITFKLIAVVSVNNGDDFDQAANKTYKGRVRQAIVMVTRSSGIEDLDDPNLGRMKRLIREQVNKVLRKSYVIEIVISDFKTMEQ